MRNREERQGGGEREGRDREGGEREGEKQRGETGRVRNREERDRKGRDREGEVWKTVKIYITVTLILHHVVCIHVQQTRTCGGISRGKYWSHNTWTTTNHTTNQIQKIGRCLSRNSSRWLLGLERLSSREYFCIL